MAKKPKRPEVCPAPYCSIPWSVLDSRAYQGATPTAKALLLELLRQHSGSNNGHLHLAHKWLAPRGWVSKETVERARKDLLKRGLIIQTKQGGLFIGASLYALTWLPVSNHSGLETSPSTYHPGGWQLCDLPPTDRRKPTAKKLCHPDNRGSLAPTIGAANEPLAPTIGAVDPIFDASPAPTIGDDVSTPVMARKNLSGAEQFKARIGGRLTVPAREPNPLGRTRHISLFKTALGHLAHNPGEHAERFPSVRALLANMPASASPAVDRQFPHVRKFLTDSAALSVATTATSATDQRRTT